MFCLLPEDIGFLSVSGEADRFSYFPIKYISVSLFFALLIGIVIMILEWGTSRRPRDIFMNALAIPALITGAINTTNIANELKDAGVEKERLIQELGKQTDIKISSYGLISTGGDTSLLEQSERTSGSSLLDLHLAYAGDRELNSASSQTLVWLEIQKEEPGYLIVLYESQNEGEAKERAKDLSAIVPKAQVIVKDNRYLVTDGGGARKKSDALLEAIRLKKLRGAIKPFLLEDRNP